MPWHKNSSVKKTGGWLAIALVVVTGFEGMVLKPYKDKLAYNILTVCMGETRGVRESDIYTVEECKALLEKGLLEFEAELNKCIKVPMTDKYKAAIISWAWNVGTPAACQSTLVRKLNAGDYEGACNQLPRWNKAGGKVLNGLVKRREAEKNLCLSGL